MAVVSGRCNLDLIKAAICIKYNIEAYEFPFHQNG